VPSDVALAGHARELVGPLVLCCAADDALVDVGEAGRAPGQAGSPEGPLLGRGDVGKAHIGVVKVVHAAGLDNPSIHSTVTRVSAREVRGRKVSKGAVGFWGEAASNNAGRYPSFLT
jgi:hypothetical protein